MGLGGALRAWKGKLLQWAVHFLFLCCIVLLLKGVHTITTNLNKLWAGHSVGLFVFSIFNLERTKSLHILYLIVSQEVKNNDVDGGEE